MKEGGKKTIETARLMLERIKSCTGFLFDRTRAHTDTICSCTEGIVQCNVQIRDEGWGPNRAKYPGAVCEVWGEGT